MDIQSRSQKIPHPQTKSIKKSSGWRIKAPAGLFPSLPAAQTLGKFNSFTNPWQTCSFARTEKRFDSLTFLTPSLPPSMTLSHLHIVSPGIWTDFLSYILSTSSTGLSHSHNIVLFFFSAQPCFSSKNLFLQIPVSILCSFIPHWNSFSTYSFIFILHSTEALILCLMLLPLNPYL